MYIKSHCMRTMIVSVFSNNSSLFPWLLAMLVPRPFLFFILKMTTYGRDHALPRRIALLRRSTRRATCRHSTHFRKASLPSYLKNAFPVGKAAAENFSLFFFPLSLQQKVQRALSLTRNAARWEGFRRVMNYISHSSTFFRLSRHRLDLGLALTCKKKGSTQVSKSTSKYYPPGLFNALGRGVEGPTSLQNLDKKGGKSPKLQALTFST